MKAVLLTGAGGIDKLELTEIPDPILDNPELILVRLHGAGINPVDYKLRKAGGFYPNRIPLILGCDGAGVVVGCEKAVVFILPQLKRSVRLFAQTALVNSVVR